MMMENLNKEGLLNENALSDDELEQVTGGKKMKIKDFNGKKMTATAGSRAFAREAGKANIAEAEATIVRAYANE